MLNLAKSFAERGRAVDLVLAHAEGPFLGDVPESVRLVDLKARRASTSLPALVRYLHRERPEVLLSVMYTNIIALLARRLAGTSTRVVVCEQNTLSIDTHEGSDWRGRLMPSLCRLFYPWAQAIVAVSGGVADDLSRVTGIPRQRIQVIYNPVVTPELRDKAQVPLHHPWFASGEPAVLLAVGRLSPQKDFPTLIQAFARVRRTRRARLLILGEGEQRPELEALVKKLGLEGDACLPGFVENPYPYMTQASLFILSSRWEGLPTVLIEALQCGLPVVSTDCPSGPREILMDGKYGQLVPVGDVTALSKAIEISLAGNGHAPPPQSWRPFELDRVINQYTALLFGELATSSPL